MTSIHDFDRLEQHIPAHLDWFVVNWCLGNTCNYACTYCPESLHDGSERWHPLESIQGFVKHVKQIHPEKKIYFEFTGGEVSLFKDFIAICKFCHENGVKVGFISNGSRTIRWWKENKQHFDHVNLSFHVEYADPKHFRNVVEEIRLDVVTHVNVMMHPDRWDECLSLATKVKDIGDASIALQPLIHDLANELYDYRPDQHYVLEHQNDLFGHVRRTKPVMEAYRGNMKGIRADGSVIPQISPQNFIGKNTNNWRGWDCWAGVEQMIVDKDGSIWRGWCRVGGYLGNVREIDLNLPTEPVLCDKNLCHCNFDIMCTKVRKEGAV
jgi:organic radical activating enzyme